RLMYWQVYLHKTVISAEFLLAKILQRSRELALKGDGIFAMPALNHFLKKPLSRDAFMNEDHHLETFAMLDDTDIMAAVKVGASHSDFVLSKLCRDLINRDLYKVDITNQPPDKQFIEELTQRAIKKYNIPARDASYFVFKAIIGNDAYKPGDGNIRILMKNDTIQDITAASDNSNLQALAKTVKKYVLCYKKEFMI
ncbi:MAG: phosphohydrolase, partial [Bacteroidota bacterium]|nr:phosphohydrolase [Bacteroidota bacterium]